MTKTDIMKDFLKKAVLPIVCGTLLVLNIQPYLCGQRHNRFVPDMVGLRSAFWHRQDVHADPDRVWYFRHCWRCCAQHCSRRTGRRRDPDLQTCSGSMVSASDDI